LILPRTLRHRALAATIRHNAVMDRTPGSPLLLQLAAALPADGLIADAERLSPYASDGLSMYRELPLAVALPQTAAEAQSVLRVCHAAGVPVIARGAGTGLAGGALPRSDAVVLSLARLKRIVRVDPLARVAVVEPGVRNAAI
jgi:glycolate oxidase